MKDSKHANVVGREHEGALCPWCDGKEFIVARTLRGYNAVVLCPACRPLDEEPPPLGAEKRPDVEIVLDEFTDTRITVDPRNERNGEEHDQSDAQE